MVNIFSYKETLDKIWTKAEGLNEKNSGIISRGYCIERHLPKNSILFLGMNPSYDGKKDAGNDSE